MFRACLIDFPAFVRFFFEATLGVEETRNYRMEVEEQDGKQNYGVQSRKKTGCQKKTMLISK